MSRYFWIAGAAVIAGVLLNAQTPAPPSSDNLQAIVVDPGHGGDDAGVSTADGLLEKQLTLDIARRIKAQIESRLGVRVILTRDDDRAMTTDERALVANNSRADLFLSLHFNAALSPMASGAQVYSQQTDREGEAALLATETAGVRMTAPNGDVRSIAFLRWDLAQARHIERSAALAAVIADVMTAAKIPMGARPRQQVPLRGLTGINMPAALIELAYLTNPTQAKEVGAAEFQGAVTQAVYDSLVRFRGAGNAPEGER